MQYIGRRTSPSQVVFVIGEALLMVAGTVLAVYFRLGTAEELFSWKYSWHRIILVPVVLQITFYYFDLYNFRVGRPFLWTATRLAQALAVGTMVLTVIYYLLPRLFLGRGVLVLAYACILGLLLLWRRGYGWMLARRIFASRVVLIGSGSLADSICEEVVSRADHRFNVVCIVDPPIDHAALRRRADDVVVPPELEALNLMQSWARIIQAEYVSQLEDLAGMVRFFNADLVVVAMDDKRGRMPLDQLLRCRMQGIPVVAGEDFFEEIAGRILASRIRPSWLIFSPGFVTGAVRRITKRIFDVSLSTLGLILASPLILLTSLAVALDSRGPLIFKQERVGQHNRAFTIYKFRSMVADAEARTGPVWAQHGDPRVTRVGRFIRRTRLDEIPQMWNVLKGDMSFVGPRPERPHFVEQLAAKLPYYNERHNVKPGITGWAQVCYSYGSSEAHALEKLNYDLYYIKHSSLSLDVVIMVQTVKLIFFGGGGGL